MHRDLPEQGPPARPRRRGVVAACAAAAMVASTLAATPAQAARPSPGDFTGFAFDTCATPDQATMDAWRTDSPFWGVGVYIGGAELSTCTQQAGVVDAAWVGRQSRRGWRVLPIWVGPQASCATGRDFVTDVDPDPRDSYAGARAQGTAEAGRAARTAERLDVRSGSTLWYDIEDFALSDTDCRRSVLTFLSAWTERLHRLGWRSGVYSNVAAGIHALDNADNLSHGSYTMPDQVWYALENGRADTDIPERWVRANSWQPHARIHQYLLDEPATYGGATLTIDHNFVDVGRGSVAPKARRTCGVRVDFADYRTLRRGSRGAQVTALQCLLKQRRVYDGRLHGRYDVATTRAVRRYQRAHGLGSSGRVNAATWTALLAHGAGPILKRGSAGDAVRRVQRALTAAQDRRLPVTGVMDGRSVTAVVRYQRGLDLPTTGVVAADTWRALRAGRS